MTPRYCWRRIAWLVGGVLLGSGADGAPERLDRRNLLEFHDASGVVLPVRSLADWGKRRAEILTGAQRVMGSLPGPEKRVPLDVRIDEEVDCGAYVRRFLTYLAEPGSRVPAYLLVPKTVLAGHSREPSPGVLCLQGTNLPLGSRLVVGLGGPDGLPNRNYGEELAQRGFVTIAPFYPTMGHYQPDLKALGYASGTMKAIWDNLRALDLLAATPGVKPGGFGVIGHSLGGHNAIYTAVFDERIKVIVSSCGFDSYLDYRDASAWLPGRGWTQERYMPRLRGIPVAEIPFDFHELVGVLAPRPFFANAPVGDHNFKWQSVDRVIAAALPVYRLHAVSDLLHVEHPDAGHDFPPAVRSLAYEWIERALR